MTTYTSVIVDSVRQSLAGLEEFIQQAHSNAATVFIAKDTLCTFTIQGSDTPNIEFSGYSGREPASIGELLLNLYPEEQKYINLVRGNPGKFSLRSSYNIGLVLTCEELRVEIYSAPKNYASSELRYPNGVVLAAKEELAKLTRTNPLAAKLSECLTIGYHICFL